MYMTCSKWDIGKMTQIKLAEYIYWRAAVLSHVPGCVTWLPGAEGTPHSQLMCLLCQLNVMEPRVQMAQGCQGSEI